MDIKLRDPAYLQIDALTCRKRFHVRYQTDMPKQSTVQFFCPECNVLLWEKSNSYPLQFLRNENLINQKNLSDIQTTQCQMFDQPIKD